jgi:hypothetical protein
MVEAWHSGNGAVSKMNSDFIKPGCCIAVAFIVPAIVVRSDAGGRISLQDTTAKHMPHINTGAIAAVIGRFMPLKVNGGSVN